MQVGAKEVDSPSTFKYANAISTATGGGMQNSASVGFSAGQKIRGALINKNKENPDSKWYNVES